MVIYYHGDENAIKSLFRWRGTLSRTVLMGFEFWLVLSLSITFTLLLDFEVIALPEGWMNISITPLGGPVLSAAIFFAVFYNSQCYGRYMNLYSGCMQVDTMVKVFAGEMLSNFCFSPELRWYLVGAVKYVIASAFFFHSSMDDKEMSMDEWDWFARKGLLTQAEIEFVRRFPGHRVLLLQHWAQQLAAAAIAHKAVAARYSPPERAAMTGRLFGQVDAITKACRTVSNTLNLPVPFPYFHLLQLLIFFSLLVTGLCCCIYAAQAGAQTFCVAVLPFSVIAFVLLAVRQLAGELSDPFGEDNVDFPQYDFMRHIYDHCAAILQVPDRFDPVAHGMLERVEEFTAENVNTPCCWMLKAAPPEARASVVRDPNGRVHSKDLMHGMRTWKRPEDWESAKCTAAWIMECIEGNEGDHALGNGKRPKAKAPFVKTGTLKSASGTPASVPPDKAPLPNKDKDVQLDALVELEEKMGRLLRIVERLPVKISEALNPNAPTETVRSPAEAVKSQTTPYKASQDKRPPKDPGPERRPRDPAPDRRPREPAPGRRPREDSDPSVATAERRPAERRLRKDSFPSVTTAERRPPERRPREDSIPERREPIPERRAREDSFPERRPSITTASSESDFSRAYDGAKGRTYDDRRYDDRRYDDRRYDDRRYDDRRRR